MYRLIAFLVVLGVIYWMVKRAFFPPKGGIAGRGGAEEEMVRDPVCGCYIPKGQSLTVSYRGKTLFFCSQECFHKYQASNTLPKS